MLLRASPGRLPRRLGGRDGDGDLTLDLSRFSLACIPVGGGEISLWIIKKKKIKLVKRQSKIFVSTKENQKSGFWHFNKVYKWPYNMKYRDVGPTLPIQWSLALNNSTPQSRGAFQPRNIFIIYFIKWFIKVSFIRRRLATKGYF